MALGPATSIAQPSNVGTWQGLCGVSWQHAFVPCLHLRLQLLLAVGGDISALC